MAIATAPTSAMSEAELMRGYSEDPAVLALRRVETRRCVCRGWVTADPIEPADGVVIHNATEQHQSWRKARDR